MFVCCRLFVRRQCGRCRQPIVYNELVVQTNELVYHSDCFSCVLCNHHFTPGQQFAVADDGNVYCPSDFQLRHSVPARDDAWYVCRRVNFSRRADGEHGGTRTTIVVSITE